MASLSRVSGSTTALVQFEPRPLDQIREVLGPRWSEVLCASPREAYGILAFWSTEGPTWASVIATPAFVELRSDSEDPEDTLLRLVQPCVEDPHFRYNSVTFEMKAELGAPEQLHLDVRAQLMRPFQSLIDACSMATDSKVIALSPHIYLTKNSDADTFFSFDISPSLRPPDTKLTLHFKSVRDVSVITLEIFRNMLKADLELFGQLADASQESMLPRKPEEA